MEKNGNVRNGLLTVTAGEEAGWGNTTCLCSAALWAASMSPGTDTNACREPWWLSAAWTQTPVWGSGAHCFPKYYLFADFDNRCLCSLFDKVWDNTSRSVKYVCLALQDMRWGVVLTLNTSVCNLLILEQPPVSVICQNGLFTAKGCLSLAWHPFSIFDTSFGFLLRSLLCQLHHEIWIQAVHSSGFFLGKP